MHIILIAVQVWRHHFEQPRLVRPTMLLSALLMVQLSLGLGAYLVKFTPMAAMGTSFMRVSLTTSHLGVGSLMLATSLVVTLRTYWAFALPKPAVAGQLLSEQVS
jgi:hypothetical protein